MTLLHFLFVLLDAVLILDDQALDLNLVAEELLPLLGCQRWVSNALRKHVAVHDEACKDVLAVHQRPLVVELEWWKRRLLWFHISR